MACSHGTLVTLGRTLIQHLILGLSSLPRLALRARNDDNFHIRVHPTDPTAQGEDPRRLTVPGATGAIETRPWPLSTQSHRSQLDQHGGRVVHLSFRCCRGPARASLLHLWDDSPQLRQLGFRGGHFLPPRGFQRLSIGMLPGYPLTSYIRMTKSSELYLSINQKKLLSKL